MLLRRMMVAIGAAASVAAVGTVTLTATPARAADPLRTGPAAGTPGLAARSVPGSARSEGVAAADGLAGAGRPGSDGGIGQRLDGAGRSGVEGGVVYGLDGVERSGFADGVVRSGGHAADEVLEPSTQDAAFLQAANAINLAGIEQGRIAWTKTKSAEVKKIAGRLMVSHIRLNAEIAEAARRLKIRLDTGPNAEQLALTRRYQAASAGSFDALYLSTQLELQQQAKRIVDTQVSSGTDASVKQVAAAASPILAGQKMLRDAIS